MGLVFTSPFRYVLDRTCTSHEQWVVMKNSSMYEEPVQKFGLLQKYSGLGLARAGSAPDPTHCHLQRRPTTPLICLILFSSVFLFRYIRHALTHLFCRPGILLLVMLLGLPSADDSSYCCSVLRILSSSSYKMLIHCQFPKSCDSFSHTLYIWCYVSLWLLFCQTS